MKYLSTRDASLRLSGAEVISRGLSREGGLFVPEEIPVLDLRALQDLCGMDYRARAAKIMGMYLTDYSAEELEQIFLRFARSYTLSPAARRELRDVCLQMEQSRTDSFGNGREVRSFFEDVVTRVAFRISSAPAANVNLKEILPEDLRQARKNWEKKHHPSPKKPPKIGFI